MKLYDISYSFVYSQKCEHLYIDEKRNIAGEGDVNELAHDLRGDPSESEGDQCDRNDHCADEGTAIHLVGPRFTVIVGYPVPRPDCRVGGKECEKKCRQEAAVRDAHEVLQCS